MSSLPGNQNISVSQSDVTGVNFTVASDLPMRYRLAALSKLPAGVDSGDPQAVEVGTKIRADSDGYILGVRFYKAVTNTGVHVGNLWTNPSSGWDRLRGLSFPPRHVQQRRRIRMATSHVCQPRTSCGKHHLRCLIFRTDGTLFGGFRLLCEQWRRLSASSCSPEWRGWYEWRLHLRFNKFIPKQQLQFG